MNEQNPKLEKIMNKVPGGLIISGIMWLIMCILIIAGMYLIKYPHFTYISVIYNGNQNNEHKNELLFTIENTDIGILQSHIKGSRVSLKINGRLLLGVITNIFAQGKDEFIEISITDIGMQKIPVGSKGQMAIMMSKKRMFELIPFLKRASK